MRVCVHPVLKKVVGRELSPGVVRAVLCQRSPQSLCDSAWFGSVPCNRRENLHSSPVFLASPNADLKGNKFRIVVRDVRWRPIDTESIKTDNPQREDVERLSQAVRETVEETARGGFINYFGPQRFGQAGEDECDAAAVGRCLLVCALCSARFSALPRPRAPCLEFRTQGSGVIGSARPLGSGHVK